MINFRETGICVLKNVLEKKALDLFSTTLLEQETVGFGNIQYHISGLIDPKNVIKNNKGKSDEDEFNCDYKMFKNSIVEQNAPKEFKHETSDSDIVTRKRSRTLNNKNNNQDKYDKIHEKLDILISSNVELVEELKESSKLQMIEIQNNNNKGKIIAIVLLICIMIIVHCCILFKIDIVDIINTGDFDLDF